MSAKKVKEIRVEVISQKGTCGMGHKPGDRAVFTESGVEGKICIHALYSMMPKAFAFMYNANFPWAKDPDRITHPCTDAANPVIFELHRVYEE